MEEKKMIRKKTQEQLRAITRPLYEHSSYKIAQRLFCSPSWQDANTIGITVSKMPEVDTYQIIRKAWEENKQVVVPKCNPIDKTMTFRTLTAFNQLESVYYGLFEPIESETEEVNRGLIDLIIVPGLAFDKCGFRVGFGGGYYDRYLQGYHGKKVSLAFSQQIVHTLPIESHDIPIDKIFTEKETIEVYG